MLHMCRTREWGGEEMGEGRGGRRWGEEGGQGGGLLKEERGGCRTLGGGAGEGGLQRG